jgi:CBS-domain-containing membrane protein
LKVKETRIVKEDIMSRWTVADVMTYGAVSVAEDTPFKEIVEIIETNGVNAVPVVDHSNRVIGLVTSADLVPKIEYAGAHDRGHLFEGHKHREDRRKSDATAAADLMTTPAVTVLSETSLVDATRIMNGGLKRLPVVDDLGRLVGMVTRKDMLKVYLRSDADVGADIAGDVLPKLVGVQPWQVRTAVQDGNVTLTGQVARRSLVAEVVHEVERVDGVVAVESQLGYLVDDLDTGAEASRRAPHTG